MLTDKFIKNKRGITLIELIVAMALTVIILTAATSFMVPLYRYYGNSVNEAKAIKVSGVIEKRLKEILPSAVEAYVTTATAVTHSGTNGYYYILVASNRIVYRLNGTSQVFLAEAAYEGFNVALEIRPKYKGTATTAYNILQITIIMTKNDVEVKRLIVINLHNMTSAPYIYLLNSPNTHTVTCPNESTVYRTIKFKVFAGV